MGQEPDIRILEVFKMGDAMTPDFKAAQEWINGGSEILKQHYPGKEKYQELDDEVLEIHDTIRTALAFMAKMQEVTKDAVVEINIDRDEAAILVWPNSGRQKYASGPSLSAALDKLKE